MTTQPDQSQEVPQARIEIPTEWLMPWLDLETVRAAQRPDTAATLTSDSLSLAGLELVVERRWLREAHWREIKQAVSRGYIYKSTAVQITLRGERREHQRRTAA